MKRFLYLALCLLIVAAMMLCFVACKNEETPEETTTPTTSGSDDNNNVDDTPAHTHTYASEYSYDDEYHYYAATCEHTSEKKDSAKHAHNPLTGECVCGHTTEVDTAGVIDYIISNRDKTTNGTISIVTDHGSYNSTSSYEYKFADNFLYVMETGDYENHYYYAFDKYGNVYGVITQGSFVNRDTEATEDNMNGPKLDFTFMGDYENYVFGMESMISYFYEMGMENGSLVMVEEEGVFGFGLGVLVEGYYNYFYVIGVSFTVNAETGTLEVASVIAQKYGDTSFTVEDDGTITLKDNVTPSSTTTIIAQVSTEAIDSIDNPYDPDKVILEDVVLNSLKPPNGYVVISFVFSPIYRTLNSLPSLVYS